MRGSAVRVRFILLLAALLTLSAVFARSQFLERKPSRTNVHPQDGVWVRTGSMDIARDEHTAMLLPSGKVLVAGGYNNNFGYLSSAQLYDPVNGTWTATRTMRTARSSHTATLLPSGQVLVAGGDGGGFSLN